MSEQPWPAPAASAPLHAVVGLPGSKSHTNRALVLSALAHGTSTLRRPLRSRDTELMVGALRVLGAEVLETADGDWRVRGGELTGSGAIDVGNAGTVARFVPPLAALGTGTVHLDGDPRVRERPVGPLLAALRQLGAELSSVTALPVTVTGRGGLPGGSVQLDASDSSQLVSGLLLAGCRFQQGLQVRHVGGPLPSAPHLAMTVQALRERGVAVEHPAPGVWSVPPGPLAPLDAAVEPDLSTAAAYLAAPLVAGGSVTVVGWPQDTVQPGAVLPELLEQMGGRIERAGDRVTVHGTGHLRGLTADLRDTPELTTTLVALAALADSPSTFTGVAHIRLQETDRLTALAVELNGRGGDVRELPDGVQVRPRPLSGGVMDSYDDHRLAMAWAVLGLAVPGTQVLDVATTRKTVPDFVASWTAMLAA